MCGRVTQKDFAKYGDKIYGWLDPVKEIDERPGRNMPIRYNLRPTEPAWIVARRDDGRIKLLEARWWAQWEGSQKFETKFPMFNARVDTMHERKLWSDLLQRGQRCLFPVESFYEWPVKGAPPVEIFVAGREPFAIAGLWSRWFENGKTRYSFTSFTCAANDFMLPIHPKAMPVILNTIEEQNAWLETGDESVLRPYQGGLESNQLPEKLEQLYPEENKKY